MDRRSFAKTLLSLPIAYAGFKPRSLHAAPKRVVIIGAGISGLATGYELHRQGHQVTVLEASPRTGGRIRTLRFPADEEGVTQCAELGATTIPDVHLGVMSYVKEFGLPIQSLSFVGNTRYYFHDQIFSYDDDGFIEIPEDFPITEAERPLGYKGMVGYYSAADLDKLQDPRKPGWRLSDDLVWGERSFLDYVRNRGGSEAACQLLKGTFGSGIEKRCTYMLLVQLLLDRQWRRSFMIKGGNDYLPAAFARRLGRRIRFGAEVASIEAVSGGYRIAYQLAGERRMVPADHVVMATSVAGLRRLHFEPSLPVAKREAIATIPMADVMRANLQTATRFWEEPIDSPNRRRGLSLCKSDSVFEKVWDMSCTQRGTSGVMTAYAQDQGARAFRELDRSDRVPYLIDELEVVFPQIRTEVQRSNMTVWSEDRLAGGAWAQYQAGMLHHLPALQERYGNLHFAGADLSIYSGWMEGGIREARRVVHEITQ